MKDLVILAADKDLKSTLDAVLLRDQALGIRPISFDVFIEEGHDPACACQGISFLNNFASQYHHALLMFDYEGCGMENTSTPSELEIELNNQFQIGPFRNRAKTILLCPELEAWVWSDSPHVSDVIRWPNDLLPLRTWLVEKNWVTEGEIKPMRPKEAFDSALYAAGRPHSSSLFGSLAGKVSFRRCVDPSFIKFCNTLQDWFQREV